MAKLFGMVMGVSIIILLLLACAPQAAPVAAPAVGTPQAAISVPAVVAPVSPEEAAWSKVVAAAKKEGKVNAYAFTWTGDIGLAVAKAFKERYSIALEITTGRGADFTERIKTEKRMRQQVGDMTEGSVGLIDSMGLEGLLVSVVDELPSLREKGVWLVEPTAMDPRGKANLTWRLNLYTPYINTKLVKAQEIPQSWKDLLEPVWKGKMGMNEPKLTTSLSQMIVTLMAHKVWDEDYIRALYRQNLRFYVNPEMFQVLARGELHLVIDGADTNAARFALEGAPIQAIDIKDGVLLTTASVAAFSGGPNPNATRVFLNWLFSQEGQNVTGKTQGNRMVRKDVPDFRPEGVRAPITNPLVITVEQLNKATELFRERWFDKVVGR